MVELTHHATRRRERLLRQDTLALLRWVAIGGQACAIGAAFLLLDAKLNYGAAISLLVLWGLANLVQASVFRFRGRLDHDWSAGFLGVDLLEMCAMLFLSGGIHNPFAIFIIVPSAFAATILDARAVMLFVALSIGAILGLYFLAAPIEIGGAPFVMSEFLYMGFALALMILVGFVAMFSWRISAENLKMNNALSASELALAREHRLSMLGGLAAAYAHELGTPLATLRLSANDLARNAPRAMRDELAIMQGEIARCTDILARMGREGEDEISIGQRPLASMVEEAAKPHRARGIEILISVNNAPSGAGEDQLWTPLVHHDAAIIHGLRNLIQNGVDFAHSRLLIDIEFDDHHVGLRIIDDGEGFARKLLGKIGEPFISARRPRTGMGDDERRGGGAPEEGWSPNEGSRGAPPGRAGYVGMGIGLFIAKNLLEGSKAKLSFANMPPASGLGAVVDIRWARADIDASLGRSNAMGKTPEGEKASTISGALRARSDAR